MSRIENALINEVTVPQFIFRIVKCKNRYHHKKKIVLYLFLFIFRSRCRLLTRIENTAAAAVEAATDLFCLQLITSFSNQIACDPIRIHF